LQPVNAASDVSVRSTARLGYVMSRFPKISETFILREIVSLRRLGFPVEIYPLLRRQQEIKHAEAEKVAAGAHYHPLMSAAVLAANWHYAVTRPAAYARMLWDVVSGTIRSPRHFPRAMALLPKAAYLAREMTRSGVTHVHAHFSNHPALIALAVHRLTGIPYSFTAHGSDLHVDQCFLAEKVREAAFAVAISQYNKDFIVERCGEDLREKILVIHCGVDPEVFQPAPKALDGPFQFLCVGSLGPVKGHRYLIEACRILRDRGVDFECHIVGDGDLREDIERRIEDAGLSDRVKLHGALRQEGVVRRMRAAHAMVLPSVIRPRGDREGIPVVLMEAMAAGLPVVSSRISGIPELVLDGETGILVEPRDPGGIADALHALAGDAGLRERLGAAGRKRVVERFDLETNVSQLCDQFSRRCAPRSPSPGVDGRRVACEQIAE
jgi:colanic acid/amylovoran biosynthesis glycosyltransferase